MQSSWLIIFALILHFLYLDVFIGKLVYSGLQIIDNFSIIITFLLSFRQLYFSFGMFFRQFLEILIQLNNLRSKKISFFLQIKQSLICYIISQYYIFVWVFVNRVLLLLPLVKLTLMILVIYNHPDILVLLTGFGSLFSNLLSIWNCLVSNARVSSLEGLCAGLSLPCLRLRKLSLY